MRERRQRSLAREEGKGEGRQVQAALEGNGIRHTDTPNEEKEPHRQWQVREEKCSEPSTMQRRGFPPIRSSHFPVILY